MRKREAIPPEYTDWLNTYLKRKGIRNYPHIDKDQWRTLRGAYRQMRLKNTLLSGSSERYEHVLKQNGVLVAEKDKAQQESLRLQNKVLSLEKLEEQANEIKQLKKQLKKSTTQILGQGVYDGSISLAIAVRLLDNIPKDSGKQSALRRQAILECGYGDIGERKLNSNQSFNNINKYSLSL